ncbi:MAG: hypothetical protein ACRC92_02630 [Peptostreptococcaceae bacterium]
MRITYDILKDLLRCNKGMKLDFRENTNILDVYTYNTVILTIELKDNNIEKNSELIYNSIINLDNITMYIPKVYIKED